MLRARVLRLAPVAVAAFELRYLLTAVGHAIRLAGSAGGPDFGSASLWLVALLALGGGLALHQMASGLGRRLIVPRWSLRLGGLWLMCASAMLLLLGGADAPLLHLGLVHASRHSGAGWASAGPGWAAAPAAAGFGLLLAVSLQGGGWLLQAVARLALRPPAGAHKLTDQRRPAAPRTALAPAPLLAGWSDRGPPRQLLFQN